MDNENIIKILNGIYALICLIGFLSNLLTFFVYSCKKFFKSIFWTYFRILCFFDIITLLNRVDYFFTVFELINLKELSNVTCKLANFISYFCPSTSAWILVIISLDRFACVCLPFKFMFRKKTQFQLYVSLFIIIYNSIIFVPLYFLSEIYHDPDLNQTINNGCSINNGIIFDWLYIVNSTLIPFSIMLLSTFFTLRRLFKSRKNNNTALAADSIKKKDIKFAFTSIGLNISFFVLNFPFSLYTIMESLIQIDYYVDYFIYIFLSILYYSHYGTLFYVSFIVNKSFRNELVGCLNKINSNKVARPSFKSSVFT